MDKGSETLAAQGSLGLVKALPGHLPCVQPRASHDGVGMWEAHRPHEQGRGKTLQDLGLGGEMPLQNGHRSSKKYLLGSSRRLWPHSWLMTMTGVGGALWAESSCRVGVGAPE